MKHHFMSAIVSVISSGLLMGCTPPFRAFSTTDVSGAAGPALTTIVDNMLCELRETANSNKKIVPDPTKPENFFTIGDRLYDINYVAMASFDLDVSHSEDLNPSAAFTPFAPFKVLTLSVGAKLSGVQHRLMTVNRSVDFEALNDRLFDTSQRANGFDGLTSTVRPDQPRPKNPMSLYIAQKRQNDRQAKSGPCGQGSELNGQLGLSEVITGGITASNHGGTGVEPAWELKPDFGAASGAAGPNYLYGVFSSTIDFTVAEGISGGPNWTLTRFDGPGKGLLNFSRTVKDTLRIAFVPACRTFRTLDTSGNPLPAYSRPGLPEGSQLPASIPVWALNLPACDIKGTQAYAQHQEEEIRAAAPRRTAGGIPSIVARALNAKAIALQRADDSNYRALLQNLRPLQ